MKNASLTFRIALVLLSFGALLALVPLPERWDKDADLSEVLLSLGDAKPLHFRPSFSPEQTEQGRQIVHNGFALLPDGKRSKYVSKFYVCTNCHNTAIEDPDLRKSDPEARLLFAKEKNLGFFQATTFYGIVNRETWYNDDYVKKYGDLVYKANKSLEESVQLCAQECSQGRKLESWEAEAILAYFWSLQYKLQDLKLTAADMEKLNAESKNAPKQEELRAWLKGFYLQKSPATFSDAPADKKEGYPGLNGEASRGKMLYEQGCQQCHKAHGVSDLVLDQSKFTRAMFKKNIAKENHRSLYKIVRYGTYATPGHRPYMPHYTLERMSHQQLEDLRAFVESNE